MPSAKSPRLSTEQTAAARLHSTHTIDGTAPRRVQSVYQAVATSRGYTVKAGSATRARLHRGVPKLVQTPDSELTNPTASGTLVTGQENP